MSRRMVALQIAVAAGLVVAPISSAGATEAESITTAGATGATTAAAASFCTAWALADRVDRTGKMYGAGGVTCKGKTAGRLTITFYRNSKKVKFAEKECPRHSACSASTGTILNSSGKQEWCARTQFHDVIGNDHYLEWACMIA
ncbi:hypothetical protein [Nonomuraea deserti]|nr:hypothetical protein [Nonomuraea deserti]